MKKQILLITALLSFTFLNAQQLSEIDSKVAQYPKTFNSEKELAALINRDFETEADKARAIYTWITTNVEFDTKTYFSKKKKSKRIRYKNAVDRANKIRNKEIKLENRALKEHLAVADGYTILYKRICDLTGVYGYILKGTAKVKPTDVGVKPVMQNHKWNVVQVGKDWFFVDAAMGAGIVDYAEKKYVHYPNDKYFFTPPEKFFYNHFPKDKGWSLTENTAEDFANLPLFTGEYLRNDFELIAPLNGVLSLQGQDSVLFRMKSPVPHEDLTYQYNFEKQPTEIPVIKDGDEYTFSVPFAVKRRGYLTLFYKSEAIISFKIEY